MTKKYKDKLKTYKNKDVLTILEVQDILQVSRTKVDALIDSGEITVRKPCEKYLVLKVDLLHYLDKARLSEWNPGNEHHWRKEGVIC